MNHIERAIATVGSASKLAQALEVSVQAVCFWRDGKRSVPVDKCTDIERATAGAVTRRDLRPEDWQRIWPELAQAEPAEQEVGHDQ